MAKQSDAPLDRPVADLEANEGSTNQAENGQRRLSIVIVGKTDDYDPKHQLMDFPSRVLGRSALNVVLYVSNSHPRGTMTTRCSLDTDLTRPLFTARCCP